MMWKISRTMSGARPEARLVEHQQPRPRHQRAAEREHLALAAGERAGELCAAARAGAESARRPPPGRRRCRARAAGSAETRRAPDCPRTVISANSSRRSGTRHRPRATRASTSVAPMQVARRSARVPRERQQPHDRVEQGGLAGAVRPDHGDDAAAAPPSRLTPVQRLDLAVGDRQVLRPRARRPARSCHASEIGLEHHRVRAASPAAGPRRSSRRSPSPPAGRPGP